ncbi:MAG: hypothetical protein GPJ54_03055, partial [Candidatus Heimdallarchaeota archaeon]|nr:hypothetical protein [Candidatus Heimdallarchaeota archaeon]
VTLPLDVWYNFRNKYAFEGRYELYVNNILKSNVIFNYALYWQPTSLDLIIDNLQLGINNITLRVFDDSGNYEIKAIEITRDPTILDELVKNKYELDEDRIITITGATTEEVGTNIFINNNIYSEFDWIGEDIVLDLNSQGIGTYNITLLFNTTIGEIIHQFQIYFYPADAPSIDDLLFYSEMYWDDKKVIELNISDPTLTYYETYINGLLISNTTTTNTFEIATINFDDYMPGDLIITVIAHDQTGKMARYDKSIVILQPKIPVIISASSIPNNELRWGKEFRMKWTILGSNYSEIYRNGILISTENVFGENLEYDFTNNWQIDKWQLGINNLTLIVFNDLGNYNTNSYYFQIFYSSGDAYVNQIVNDFSSDFSYGENVIGEPDGLNAEIYVGYEPGRITMDMGEDDPIIDGFADDFFIVAKGTYDISVTSDLSAGFQYLGNFEGNQSIDLLDYSLKKVRFVQIQLNGGYLVTIDTVVALNHDKVTEDTEKPKYTELADIQISNADEIIELIWQFTDDTPWNYSISVNNKEVIYQPWTGEQISFKVMMMKNSSLTIRIKVFDLFGNNAEDDVEIFNVSISSTAGLNPPPQNTNTEEAGWSNLMMLVIVLSFIGPKLKSINKSKL